ncbi:MAG: bifunctional homocysteine S-methyltransferase/methylenetetrahydrofolate reductase [Bacilli bacterium]|nr:bifunctional homocysteine S-methyltransferase/methylenetetrahydrofolate reductase [Bacilli bacterium]
MKRKSVNKYLDYIFDGAFGTYFASKYGIDKPCELANISMSDKVIAIHEEYIKAGVNAIKTNTFRLNSSLIDNENYRNLLIKKAIKNAREAINHKNVNIFGDIGPINIGDDNEHEYLEIVKVFEKCGVKNFIFETNIEYESLLEAINYIKNNIQDSKVIVSFGVNQDGYTQLGYYYLDLCHKLKGLVDYFGLNCICGPTHMYQLATKLDTLNYNIALMPNAGYPEINSVPLFNYNPDYFSDILLKMTSLDIKVIGGCCGSTPAHMEAYINKINHIKIDYVKPIEQKVIKIKYHNKIIKMFNNHQKVIATELETPLDLDTDYLYEACFLYQKYGSDLITLVDSPLGKTRADSLLIASRIKSELKIDIVPHLTCRDKNQIALKGGLLGANICGINNILALSGDAVAQIDREVSKGVFNFNSFNLISYISNLNNDIFNEYPYLIAGALNVNSSKFDNELKRALKKIDCGVNYFITQSIFTKEAIENLKKAKKVLNKPILAGLYPVASYRNALFLNNEVKGIKIPDELIKALSEAKKDDYFKISLNFIKDIINKIAPYCDGYYLSTPLRKHDYVIDIIKYIKGNNHDD